MDNVLLDFDGTILTNSQQVAFEVLSKKLKECGIQIAISSLFEKFLGLRGEVILDHLERRHGPFCAKEKFMKDVRNDYFCQLQRRGVMDLFLPDVLNRSRRNFICSSNNKEFIIYMLRALNIDCYFKRSDIFAQEDIEEDKPAPEIYLKCRHLNALDLRNSFVVEDSISGVASATKAGFRTYGYSFGLPVDIKTKYSEKLLGAGACKVVKTFKEINDEHNH